MDITKKLLAKWSSQRGKYWIELYAEFGPEASNLLPGYSYKGDSSGGYIGTVALEVALQHAARQAGYSPSKCPRVFYDDAVARECVRLWAVEAEKTA